MFNLVSGGVEGSSRSSSNISEEDIKGYVEVPREEWMNLERGTRIVYSKTKGGFVKGPTYVNSKSEEKQILYLVSSMSDPNSFKTNIYVSNISRLWKRSDSDDLQSLARVVAQLAKKIQASETSLNPNDIHITQLSAEVTKLSMRIDNLEFNVKKIYETLGEVIERIND